MNLFTAMAIGSQLNSIPYSPYQPESLAIFAAMVPYPDTARKDLIDALVVTIKTQYGWGNLDCLQIYGSHSEQAGTINWINPAGPWTASLVGSAYWTADTCFGNVNSVGSGINTGFYPNAGVKFSDAGAEAGYYLTKAPTLPSGSTAKRPLMGAMTTDFVSGQNLPWHTQQAGTSCLSYREGNNRLQVALNTDLELQTPSGIAKQLGLNVLSMPISGGIPRIVVWQDGSTIEIYDSYLPGVTLSRPDTPIHLGAVALGDGLGGHVVKFPSNAEFGAFSAGKVMPIAKRQILADAIATYLTAIAA